MTKNHVLDGSIEGLFEILRNANILGIPQH
jgi:hypothetical protein